MLKSIRIEFYLLSKVILVKIHLFGYC